MPLSFTEASADEIEKRVYDLADLLNLRILLNRKPKELSIGQKQKVAIAKAIIKKPDLYLFDEAFSNLDIDTTKTLIYELKKIFVKLSATVIFVTHSLQEAMAIGDYIYVMNEGKLIEKIEAHNLLKSENKITQELIQNEFKDVLPE